MIQKSALNIRNQLFDGIQRVQYKRFREPSLLTGRLVDLNWLGWSSDSDPAAWVMPVVNAMAPVTVADITLISELERG